LHIASIIKTRRKALGLTQADLADMAGVSRSYICDIETGRLSPSIKTLLRIAEPLSLSLFLQENDGNTIQKE